MVSPFSDDPGHKKTLLNILKTTLRYFDISGQYYYQEEVLFSPKSVFCQHNGTINDCQTTDRNNFI